jgi:hypothetical protein
MLPTAPIPVHTAYAVPNGSERSASAISAKLDMIATAVAAVGQKRVNPSEYLRPSAQPISSRPAPSNASHALMVSAPLTLSANQRARRCGFRDRRRPSRSPTRECDAPHSLPGLFFVPKLHILRWLTMIAALQVAHLAVA